MNYAYLLFDIHTNKKKKKLIKKVTKRTTTHGQTSPVDHSEQYLKKTHNRTESVRPSGSECEC